MQVVRRPARRQRRASLGASQPEHAAQRRPLASRCRPTAAIHSPSRARYTPCGAADALRLLVAAHEVPVGVVLDDLLGHEVGGHVEHGQLDVLALPRPLPVGERGDDGERGVGPGQRIACARDVRGPVVVARDPGQARHLLHARREAGPVAPRPVEPEPGHPHHDHVGPHGAEPLVGQVELLEHAGREVLDHHVARRRQAQQQVPPAGIGQVERDVALVEVDGEVDVALVVPAVDASAGRAR